VWRSSVSTRILISIPRIPHESLVEIEFSKLAIWASNFNGELKSLLRARGIKEDEANYEYDTLVHTKSHLALWSGWLARASFSSDSASNGQCSTILDKSLLDRPISP
jgi:hypothetical protein